MRRGERKGGNERRECRAEIDGDEERRMRDESVRGEGKRRVQCQNRGKKRKEERRGGDKVRR